MQGHIQLQQGRRFVLVALGALEQAMARALHVLIVVPLAIDQGAAFQVQVSALPAHAIKAIIKMVVVVLTMGCALPVVLENMQQRQVPIQRQCVLTALQEILYHHRGEFSRSLR